jgi:hypothetical protein
METPSQPVYSDAALRISDRMNLHAVAGNAGRWASFRLSDGHEVIPHTAYGSRIEAVRFAGWDRDTTIYLEIKADGMPAKDAEEFLSYARFLHDQGWRLPSPDFDFEGIGRPAFAWDRAAYANHLINGK